eukprot:TRINITY_DN104037_c0_g1_i1.p1 TRINITY_DN104037_c0_g1~~TRINITY_DN104037_c0_g1_i1.p1  ORF type:complete len:672 (-),score=54.13 TRINITY_DN104037_c0_g1_i1:140-1897(-)
MLESEISSTRSAPLTMSASADHLLVPSSPLTPQMPQYATVTSGMELQEPPADPLSPVTSPRKGWGKKKDKKDKHKEREVLPATPRAFTPRPSAARVAKLWVTIGAGHQLTAKSPYIKLIVEEVEQSTKIIKEGHEPIWDQTFEFGVGDVTTDLLLVIREYATIQRKAIGRIVIPLCEFVSLASGTCRQSFWASIYPNKEEERHPVLRRKYEMGIHRVKGSGMKKAQLGSVYLDIWMQLEVPVHQAYCLPCYSVWDRAAQKDQDGNPEFNRLEMRTNIFRLKNVFGMPYLVMSVLPFPQCLVLLPIHTMLCYYTKVSWIPLLFFAAVVAGGVASVCNQHWDHVILWEEELEKDYSLLNKFGRYKGIFGDIQYAIGTIATVLEKSCNVWNWTDPLITLFALCALGSVCLFLSVLLAILPVRLVIWLAGLAVIVPVIIRGYAKQHLATTEELVERHRPQSEIETMDQIGTTAAPQNGAPGPAPTPFGGAAAAALAQPAVKKNQNQKKRLKQKLNSSSSLQSVPDSIWNFLERIPDGKEAAHRQICKTAINRSDDPPPGTITTGGSQPTVPTSSSAAALPTAPAVGPGH